MTEARDVVTAGAVEVIARHLCACSGTDPDAISKVTGEPSWQRWHGREAEALLLALTAAGYHLHRWQDISEAPKDGTAVLMTNHGPGMNVRIGFHVPLERRRRDEPIDEAWWAQREEIDEHHRCGMRPSVFAPLLPAPPEPKP